LKNKKDSHSLLEILQFLSIDVVLGTLAVGYMITRILDVQPLTMWWLILPMVVWVVYSLDHIIDSTRRKEKACIPRHRFHHNNLKKIIFAIIVVGTTAIWLSIIYLDFKIVLYGIFLSVLIGLYFLIIFFLKNRKLAIVQKELFIALAYVSGITLAPLYWYGALPSFSVIIVILCLFLLAWAEGIMISYFDFEKDIEDGHTSLTIIMGRKITRRLLLLVHISIETFLVVVVLSVDQSIVLIVAIFILLFMNALLGIVILFSH